MDGSGRSESGAGLKRVCLVLSLGTREPTIEAGSGRRPLSSGEGVVAAALQQAPFRIKEQGLYRRALRLKDKDGVIERLDFPIVGALLARLEGQGKRPDRIVALVTDANERRVSETRPPGKAHPTDNDTRWAGELLRQWLKARGYGEEQVAICKLDDRQPHLYDHAWGAVRRVAELRSEALAQYGEVFSSVSAGLPMVNAAVQRHLLQVERRRKGAFSGGRWITLLQVNEPLPELTEEEELDAAVEMGMQAVLGDYVREALPAVLAQYDYVAAAKLAEMAGQLGGGEELARLVKEARELWELGAAGGTTIAARCFERALLACEVARAHYRCGRVGEWAGKIGDVEAYARDLVSAHGLAGGTPGIWDLFEGQRDRTAEKELREARRDQQQKLLRDLGLNERYLGLGAVKDLRNAGAHYLLICDEPAIADALSQSASPARQRFFTEISQTGQTIGDAVTDYTRRLLRDTAEAIEVRDVPEVRERLFEELNARIVMELER